MFLVNKYKILWLSLFTSNLFAASAPDLEFEEKEESSVVVNLLGKTGYYQNPYITMPSYGGIKLVAESQLTHYALPDRILTAGAWNLQLATSYYNQNGFNNYGGGLNLFAQTGNLYGFSVGGFLTLMNPYSNEINPTDLEHQALGLSINEQSTFQELFLEYKFLGLLTVDAGWIGVNNSPWLTYYQNNALNLITYQGVVANMDLGHNLLLTGLAINGVQKLGENNFNTQTYYQPLIDDYVVGNGQQLNTSTSPDTLAIGINWNTLNDNLNVRAWDYNFSNYSNLLYADSRLGYQVTNDLKLAIGIQGGLQSGGSNNALNNNGLGNNILSNLVGGELSVEYSWLELKFGYNNIWENTDSFDNGNIVSPYTYTLATDPLYTTSWITGLVDQSAGIAYKTSANAKFLDDNLLIGLSYANYQTSIVSPFNEYDLTVSYAISQVRGLTIFAGIGYVSPVQFGSENDDTYEGQLMVTYLY